MAKTEASEHKVGGRPRTAQPHDVAAIGLRLFAEHGYQQVTMTQIAKAAGISRATLLRYFPTKVDIVWDHTDAEIATLRQQLATAPPDVDYMDVLCDTLPSVLLAEYADADFDLLRTQVLIIDGEGRALTQLPRLRGWLDAVREFVANRSGHSRDSLFTELLVECIFEAQWVALRHWAHSHRRHPHGDLCRALELLRSAFQTE